MTRMLLLLTILLTSAICSCRSQKHVAEQSAVESSMAVERHAESSSADELLAAIKSNSDVSLSEVTITFFPPDSTHPNARAAPASMTIGSVNAKKNTNADFQHKSETTEIKSESSIAEDSVSASTKSEKEFSNKPTLAGPLIFLVFSFVIIAYLIYRVRAPTHR